VGNDELTNEGSPTLLHIGGDDILADYLRGETALGNIINLFGTRSAEVDAIECLATKDGGGDLDESFDSQGTGDGLNAR
jgi:hypothetical protein